MTLKLVLLSAGLLPSLWLSSTADVGQQQQQPEVSAEKRFSINMMDPFTRRSALDKNFVRFGRSEGSSLRVSRGRNDNFVRFGRSNNEDEIPDEIRKREDSSEEDESMIPKDEMDLVRFGRARSDNFIRFGRARADNFIRFGRGMDRANNGFIRFGRARPDNFIRFGRARPDNFIRFGRARPDNFIRFGRARADNFIRFGRNQLKPISETENRLKLDSDTDKPGNNYNENDLAADFMSLADDNEDMFGRTMRGNSKLNSNFVRFGKRVPENNEEVVNAYKNGLKLNSPQGREFLERFVRQPSRSNMKSDSFIRFGRSLDDDTPSKNLKSVRGEDKSSSLFRENTMQDGSDEFEESKISSPDILVPSFESESENLSRKKRTLVLDDNNLLKNNDKTLVADRSNLSSSFYSPLAAGLPGLILGPELSVLPLKETNKNCVNKEKTKNFIRLG